MIFLLILDIELDSTSFQLLVIDVHITLPRATGLQQGRGVASLNTARSVSSRGSSMTGITPRTALDVDNCEENLTARSRISEGTAASGHISISKYSSKPNTPATIGDNSSFPDPSNDFVVDIHQVVGIFSLDNEKEPPNLDFGLFSWNYFRDYHMEQKAMYSNKQRTNVNSPTNAKQQAQNIPPINTKERIFSYPNQTTGNNLNDLALRAWMSKLSRDS